MAKDPLHGVTLEMMVTELVAFFGWRELGERIPINCFTSDPSVPSSLKFLRRTPWARAKVEGLYGFMLREAARRRRREGAAGGDVNAGADVEAGSDVNAGSGDVNAGAGVDAGDVSGDEKDAGKA